MKRSSAFAELLREALGNLSFREAEDKTDVSYSSIWTWSTRGKRPTDPTLVRQVADGLGYPRTRFLDAAGFAMTDEDRLSHSFME